MALQRWRELFTFVYLIIIERSFLMLLVKLYAYCVLFKNIAFQAYGVS